MFKVNDIVKLKTNENVQYLTSFTDLFEGSNLSCVDGTIEFLNKAKKSLFRVTRVFDDISFPKIALNDHPKPVLSYIFEKVDLKIGDCVKVKEMVGLFGTEHTKFTKKGYQIKEINFCKTTNKPTYLLNHDRIACWFEIDWLELPTIEFKNEPCPITNELIKKIFDRDLLGVEKMFKVGDLVKIKNIPIGTTEDDGNRFDLTSTLKDLIGKTLKIESLGQSTCFKNSYTLIDSTSGIRLRYVLHPNWLELTTKFRVGDFVIDKDMKDLHPRKVIGVYKDHAEKNYAPCLLLNEDYHGKKSSGELYDVGYFELYTPKDGDYVKLKTDEKVLNGKIFKIRSYQGNVFRLEGFPDNRWFPVACIEEFSDKKSYENGCYFLSLCEKPEFKIGDKVRVKNIAVGTESDKNTFNSIDFYCIDKIGVIRGKTLGLKDSFFVMFQEAEYLYTLHKNWLELVPETTNEATSEHVIHSSNPEFEKLKNDKDMETLRDKTIVVDIPYLANNWKELKVGDKVRVKNIAVGTKESDGNGFSEDDFQCIGKLGVIKFLSSESNGKYRDSFFVTIESWDHIFHTNWLELINEPEETNTIEKLFNSYIDNVCAYVCKVKVLSPYSNQEKDPDEQFMLSVEERAGVAPIVRDYYRKQILEWIKTECSKGKQVSLEGSGTLKKALEKLLADKITDKKDITEAISDWKLFDEIAKSKNIKYYQKEIENFSKFNVGDLVISNSSSFKTPKPIEIKHIEHQHTYWLHFDRSVSIAKHNENNFDLYTEPVLKEIPQSILKEIPQSKFEVGDIVVSTCDQKKKPVKVTRIGFKYDRFLIYIENLPNTYDESCFELYIPKRKYLQLSVTLKGISIKLV